LHTQDTAILHAAIDSGINYFDTAHGYQNGACEETLGKVMKTRRNEIFLVTKVSTGTIDTMRQKIETSLKRLQTDCVDLLLVHGPGKKGQILNEDIIKLYDDMRRSGKTRFVGFSTHNQVGGLEAAVESKFWQAVSLPYNYFSPPEVSQAIEKARQAGIAITAMKALITVKRPRKPFPDIREGKTKQVTNQQALLRWVLNDNNVDTVIPGIASFEQLADDTAVMGTKLSMDDREIIRRYTESVRRLYCRGIAGCDGCSEQCPYGVNIQELNRCVNYAYGYGDTRLARDNHAHLPKSSQVSRCDSCDECTVTCVNGLDLSKTVRRARELFA
ncbi:aldo/keto reductase, partial [Candidatus Omnitrophota bacterium]